MKKLLISTALFAATLLLLSCKTIKEIPEDKTSAQIIQMGQNSVSVSDYKSAVFCYETAIERYGSDPALYVEAKYELAHTYLKQKKYDKAYTIYNEILELYDAYGTTLPGAYKKLCLISLEQIPTAKLQEIQQ